MVPFIRKSFLFVRHPRGRGNVHAPDAVQDKRINDLQQGRSQPWLLTTIWPEGLPRRVQCFVERAC